MSKYQLLGLAVALTLILGACTMLSFQTAEEREAAQFVGRWVARYPSGDRYEGCPYFIPKWVEFLKDGSYVVTFPLTVWRGKTWAVVEDGRLKVDLGTEYAVYEYEFVDGGLILKDPGSGCWARYVPREG